MSYTFYRSEEERMTANLLRVKNRNDHASQKFDQEISELREQYAKEPSAKLEHDIQVCKEKIKAHQIYFDESEAQWAKLLDGARALRKHMDKEMLEAWSWWCPGEAVDRFEKGEMNYEVFREEKNIEILREAYVVHGPRHNFPANAIILTIAEEILACKYMEPEQGNLYKESFGGLKK